MELTRIYCEKVIIKNFGYAQKQICIYRSSGENVINISSITAKFASEPTYRPLLLLKLFLD